MGLLGRPLDQELETDAQLLTRNLWHHQGTQEEPLLLQDARIRESDTPKVRSLVEPPAEGHPRPKDKPELGWPHRS